MVISQRNLIKTLNPKNLKKVEEINNRIKELYDAISEAYSNKNQYNIDESIKVFFEYLDSMNIPKDNDFYIQMRNHTWQNNHLKVIASMSKLMQKSNRMPTTTEISEDSGLSEETIYKHLREFKEHDLHKHETEKYKFMVHLMLTTVYNLGIQGDIKACKVYLEYFKDQASPKPLAFEQNNYIQINNMKITPDEIQSLPIATLQKIERLISTPTIKKKRVN